MDNNEREALFRAQRINSAIDKALTQSNRLLDYVAGAELGSRHAEARAANADAASSMASAAARLLMAVAALKAGEPKAKNPETETME